MLKDHEESSILGSNKQSGVGIGDSSNDPSRCSDNNPSYLEGERRSVSNFINRNQAFFENSIKGSFYNKNMEKAN